MKSGKLRPPMSIFSTPFILNIFCVKHSSKFISLYVRIRKALKFEHSFCVQLTNVNSQVISGHRMNVSEVLNHKWDIYINSLNTQNSESITYEMKNLVQPEIMEIWDGILLSG